MNKIIKKHESGSMLVLASFIIATLSLLVISYWLLIRVNTKMLKTKENNMRCYYAAKGGIEDAIYEIRSNHTWGDTGSGFSPNWIHISGATYQKTKTDTSLKNFDYPITINVTLSGNPDSSTINIISQSFIQDATQQFQKKLQSEAIKSLTGEVIILSTKEIHN
jgi:hypothetical protein